MHALGAIKIPRRYTGLTASEQARRRLWPLQWGLRGYRVGRYLRFRERHVEEWLRTREA